MNAWTVHASTHTHTPNEFDYAALIDDTYFNKSVNYHGVRSVVTDFTIKKRNVKWG